MKKILKISLFAVLAIAFAGICATAFGKDRHELRGSGNIITRTMDTPKFNGIKASCDVQVTLSATADKITISADDNLMQYVKVEVDEGTLVATMDTGGENFRNVSNLHISVTVPVQDNLLLLKASSDAGIASAATLRTNTIRIQASSDGTIDLSSIAASSLCDLSASSDGKIAAKVQAPQCKVSAHSDGRIDLTGSTDQCTANVSSDGVFSAADFAIKDGDINASSDGRATVQVSGEFKARASSDGVVRNTIQSASSDVSKSSDGRVIQM